MKVELEKQTNFEKSTVFKTHDCEVKEKFSDYLEKALENEIEELKREKEIEEEKTTSLFAEKKVGKRRTDIYDLLIDI